MSVGRLLLGSVLSAVVIFVWGFLFWAVLPFPFLMFRPIPNPEPVVAALKERLPRTGIYMYPVPQETPDGDAAARQAAEAAWIQAHTAGPLLQVMYRAEGAAPMAPWTMLAGFVHMWCTALVVAGLLGWVAAGLPRYGQRVGFVAGLGVFSAVWINLAEPIWFFFPWDVALFNSIYDAGAWILAAPVLAFFVRAREATPTS